LSPNATLSVNPAGKILTWSDDAEELLGYSEIEAVGRSVQMIIPLHLRRRHNARLSTVCENGRQQTAGNHQDDGTS
jgi:PAS domain S-box-containing protein